MLRVRISPLVPAFIVFIMLLGCSGGSDSAPPASTPTNGRPNSGSPPVQLGRFDAPVFAVIAMPDGTGDLMVGGSFTTYDGRPVRPVVLLRRRLSTAPMIGCLRSARRPRGRSRVCIPTALRIQPLARWPSWDQFGIYCHSPTEAAT